MILSLSKITEVIKAKTDQKIEAAREMSKKLIRNVEGIGLQEYLSQINNYETHAQFAAREKHAVSNKAIVEELLRPTDNAFNARGGSKDYEFIEGADINKNSLIEKLSKIRNSHSLNWYIENEWFNKFITDPNGLIVIESDGIDIKAEERNAYPTYKSIFSIKAYQQNGIFVDWVIFEPHSKIDEVGTVKELYWALDEKAWYLVRKLGEVISIETTIVHKFKKVPAILCSDITDNVTGWKKSPIDAQIELLDQFCTKNSVLNIVEFFHNYPKMYMFAEACSRCNGTGNIGEDHFVRCDNPNCSAGKIAKPDVTDVYLMKVPEDGQPIIDKPGDYMTVPVNSLKLMYESIERQWNRMFFSHWGTVVSRDTGKDYSTATGRYIDAQPVNNRLTKYSKSIERAHTALADFIGIYYFPLTFKKAFIQYGRRYLIETPDQIWEKYVKAKEASAPVSTLDILIYQYLESEYRENETMYIVETKKVKLEPFVHWSIKIVRESTTISNEDKQKKEFFGEWIQTKTVEEMFEKDIENLRNELNDFVLSKKIPDKEPIINTIENETI
jgi:hypothetical protein